MPWLGIVRNLALTALIAIAYYLAARLGIAVSIGPGSVTSVWPPSGLALAMVILYRWRALPGLVLGSLMLNYYAYLGAILGMTLTAFLGACTLTLGSMVQAYVAAYILREVPNQVALASGLRASIRFIVVVGLACTIAATIGTVALFKLGVVAPRETTYSWLVWWVGDCSGMLVFTPLLLLLLHPGIRRNRLDSLTFFILCAGIGLTLMATSVVGYLERGARVEAFKASSRMVANVMQNEVDAVLGDLFSLQTLYFKVQIFEPEFHSMTHLLASHRSAPTRFNWMPLVEHKQRKTFENNTTGLAGKPIRQQEADGTTVAATVRGQYFPVLWSSPLSHTETLIGLDAAYEPWRTHVIDWVVQEGTITATAPQLSSLAGEKSHAFVEVFAPVADTIATDQYASSKLRGLVSITLNPIDLLRHAREQANAHDVYFSLADTSVATPVVINLQADESTLRLSSAAEAQEKTTGVHSMHTIRVADRTWQIKTTPAWIEETPTPSYLQMGMALSGFAFTALLTGFMVLRRRNYKILQDAHDTLEHQVQERTANLAQTNATLSTEIAMRRALENDLRQAQTAADLANQAKSMFLANMSHEIRTPLNAIIGYTQLMLEDSTLPERLQRQLHTVLTAGQRLLRLINDILDISKIEAGSLQLVPEVFDVRAELNDVADLFANRAHQRALEFHVDLALENPSLVEADRTKLGQMVANLLSNAIKFTDRGSVSLSASRDGQWLDIWVRDTGCGIAAQEIEQLFTPFKQAQSGLDKGGTGLGLSLSKRLAQAMGGDLHLSSQQDQGTQAHLRLPLAPAEARHNTPQMAPINRDNQSMQLDSATPCTVLVVEDDLDSREVLTQMLRNMGCTVLVAEDGRKGLQTCSTQAIDIVLTDIRMPGMTGLEMAQTIRATPSIAHLPLIAVTASSLEHERRFYLAQGFTDFVGKPYVFSDIHRVLVVHAGIRLHARNPIEEQATPAEEPTTAPPKLTETQRQLLGQLHDFAELGNLREATRIHHALQESGLHSTHLDELDKALKSYDFALVQTLASGILAH